MDWLERWLGMSPDGGNGSLELLLVLLGAVLVSASLQFRKWPRPLSGPPAERIIQRALRKLQGFN